MNKIKLLDTVTVILFLLTTLMISYNLLPKASVNVIETGPVEVVNLDSVADLPPFEETVVLPPTEPEIMQHVPEIMHDISH